VTEHPHLETLVRDLAEETAEAGDLKMLLDAWDRDTSAERLSSFVRRGTTDRPNVNLAGARQQLVDLTTKRARAARTEPTVPADNFLAVEALVLLLTWADVLADDGYMDPRLRRRWDSEAGSP